jgi:UPF0716 protein FxsA
MLPFLFLVVPVLEIATFIAVGSEIGVLPTILLVIATAITGVSLMRIQGLGTLNRIRVALDQGKVPDRELVHGLMILLAGVLLLMPGFLTDILGILLFVPPIRDLAWRFLRSRVGVVVSSGGFSGFGGFARRPDDGRTIELDEDEFSRTDRGDSRSPRLP